MIKKGRLSEQLKAKIIYRNGDAKRSKCLIYINCFTNKEIFLGDNLRIEHEKYPRGKFPVLRKRN